jgi:hypothetical protein
MHSIARTPSILVTLGRCSRLFNLYLTTAPTSLDAPSTITLHAAPLVNIAVLADVSLPLDAADAQVASRLVLVDSLELDWQRTQLRTGGYRLIGADRFLFGPDSLEKWLWQRLQRTSPDAFGNGAKRRSETP